MTSALHWNEGRNVSEFEELRDVDWADGTIRLVRSIAEGVVVEFVDWREQTRRYEFKGVSQVLLNTPHSTDLSHVTISRVECELTDGEQPVDDLYRIEFVSAWDDQILLSINAEQVVLDPSTG